MASFRNAAGGTFTASYPNPVRAALSTGKRMGHLVTRRRDASALVTCHWIDLEGSDIVFGTIETTTSGMPLNNLREVPRALWSIEGDPGEFLAPFAVISGLVEIEDRGPEGWLEVMDRLAHKYVGKPFPHREVAANGLVVRTVVDRVTASGMV
ncbi:MAG: hypothetical protein ACT4PW_03510 [Acidimicrobiia bacterium]